MNRYDSKSFFEKRIDEGYNLVLLGCELRACNFASVILGGRLNGSRRTRISVLDSIARILSMGTATQAIPGMDGHWNVRPISPHSSHPLSIDPLLSAPTGCAFFVNTPLSN